jgi:hypothetical protein
MEFFDMYYSRLYFDAYEDDREYERTAWSTSMIMSSSGNYGKKGIDAKKLYKRQFDSEGNLVESQSKVNSIDRTERDNKLNELMEKFNKTSKN